MQNRKFQTLKQGLGHGCNVFIENPKKNKLKKNVNQERKKKIV